MVRIVRPARGEGGLVHQLLVIIAMSALSGVLIAGLALPWVGLVSKGAENSAEAVQNFPKELKFKPLNERTRVLAADGSRLAVFFDENRAYVPLEQISTTMKQAIIAIEDARFFAHGALDVQGTLRALLVNQASDAKIQGGSSITQQLVKLTLQENASSEQKRRAASAQSYGRKFDELRYAVWVEQHLSKNKILEHYLNTAYFGDGAYGIQSAAHHYFSTTAQDLTLSQAAMLAGVVKNPSGYDPTNHAKAALNRRDTVIDKMLELHVISTKQAKKASKRQMGLKVKNVPNGCVQSIAPFFCQYVQKYLLASPALGETADARRHALFGGGLTIKTTIDPRFQKAADKSVADHAYATDRAIGGLAMVEPGTGYVRALAQSRTMGDDKRKGETYLNFTVPTRYGDAPGFQPGSTFKAFVLAAAISQGIPLNKTIYAPPSLTVNQGDFKICGGRSYPSTQPYPVQNSTTSGNMDLYTGTQNSVNTFYIQLEELTGLCDPVRLAAEMGIDFDSRTNARVPSFTLGVSDVSPLEMAEAYATFAARGLHCPSTPVTEITDRDGEVIALDDRGCSRVLKPAYADAINDILRGVMAPPDGFGAAIAPNQPSAGKTGTTQDNHSVWFVGYTPTLSMASMLAGVNAKDEPQNLIGKTVAGVRLFDASGSGTAGPMWGDAMSAIEQWLPNRDFVLPDPLTVKGQTVAIPSFYGLDPEATARQLTKLGLRPEIGYSVNSSAPQGTVAYTSPSSEGTSGETVLIYISSGYTPPPPPPPTQPSPTQPSPTQPSPTQPAPTKPAPTTPAPTKPTPTKPSHDGPGKPDKPDKPPKPH
ncbi:MAG: penicillin-binding protein [Propionibacteriales bacterium]|nr:penicillin-binding protein [Propionibacteriales bacterium]